MKVSLNEIKTAKFVKKVVVKNTVKPAAVSTLPPTVQSVSRFSLERNAEELSPDYYIKARAYLAGIEQEQMYKQFLNEL